MGSERAIVVNKKMRGGGSNSQILAFSGMAKRTLGLKNMDKSDICGDVISVKLYRMCRKNWCNKCCKNS